jgi:hypothetical protein
VSIEIKKANKNATDIKYVLGSNEIIIHGKTNKGKT